DDTQPYLDALTTVPALIAQVLMILVYREHWFIWLAVDILSVVLWLRAGDYCMAAQYAFWCANCLYGLHRWRSLGISKE
ncbi:MAG: nicotinamide mononucleotide transporter, partial [Paludibacteraceae bacterium]|nr:nicotinamide mononucleotide transporter [Paludibacteraceae bacterium]